MSNAYEDLKKTIHDAIRQQVAHMLADPGPYVQDMDQASEHLMLLVVGALTASQGPTDIGGWMIKRYGNDQVHEVEEFDPQDTFAEGVGWAVYTKRNAYEEGGD